jgi:apolipoprotein N-acyltransferase
VKNNQPHKSEREHLMPGGLSKNILLSVFSGILLFLSFPKYGSGILAWIALIPLFYTLKKTTEVKKGLLLGFITALVSYIGLLYWIAYVTVNYGHLPLYVGMILMLLLASYLSLYVALFSGCVVYLQKIIPVYLSAPVLWVCFEYGKSIIITGFPWENLGYSQYSNLYIIQIADVTGVWGISFLIILVNATLLEIMTNQSKKKYILAGVVFSFLVAIFIYGFYRVDQVRKIVNDLPETEVSLIQGNVEQAVKWNENYQRETLARYERLSLEKSPGNNSLIVWPETAAPFRFQDLNYLHDQIVNLAFKTKSWLLFGSISRSEDDHFNSAYLLSPAGEVRGKYDKVHLVPYGEYVPLRKFMPFVRGLTAGIGDFRAGPNFYPLSIDDKKIGVLICYEAILSHAVRTYKGYSAELLVNITNDAWFGATSAPYQHFSMTVLRAVETRLYLIRAANTGISGIIDPTGRIIAQTDIFQEDVLKGYIKFVKIPTIYDECGDIIVLLCFALMFFYFMFNFTRRSAACR